MSAKRLGDRLGTALEDAKMLIFTNSRGACDEVASTLRRTPALSRCVWAHHTSLAKEARLNTEAEFAKRRPAICVATSTLELGIDIGDIDIVGLWDPPMGWASFVQRVGRGNRRSDSCEVLGIVRPDRAESFWPALRFEALYHQLSHGRLDAPPALSLYGAVGQQLASIVEAVGTFERRSALASTFDEFGELDRSVVDEILDEMANEGVFQVHPANNQVAPAAGLHRLRDLLQIWSNFPLKSRTIRLKSAFGAVGDLPGQNLLRLRKGAVFALGRDHWEVTGGTAFDLTVRRTGDPCTTKIRYGGLPAAMDPSLVDEARKFLIEDGSFERTQRAARSLLVDLGRPLGVTLAGDAIPMCLTPAGYLYATFGGQRFNRQLSRFVGADPDSADEVFVVSRDSIDFGSLPSTTAELLRDPTDFEADADLTIYQEMLPREMLSRELSSEFTLHPRTQSVLDRIRNAPTPAIGWPDVEALRIATQALADVVTTRHSRSAWSTFWRWMLRRVISPA